MHRTTFFFILHILLAMSFLGGLAHGVLSADSAGWLLGPEIGWPALARRFYLELGSYRRQLAQQWPVALLRCLVLGGLWHLSGQVGPAWLPLVPWLVWLLPDGRLRTFVWHIQRLVLVSDLGLAWLVILQGVPALWEGGIGMSCVVCGGEKASIQVRRLEDGRYQAEMCGHFSLQVAGDHPFRLRLLLIFLGLLQTGNDQRQSRRTRDGRTPFIRQEQLAAGCEVKQACISRWNRYWLNGEWAKLLSLKTAEVLTEELVAQIVTVLATFPAWNNDQVYHYLHEQGMCVSLEQVEQASQQSGWHRLQASLQARYDFTQRLRLKDEWLVGQLLHQVQDLLLKLETASGLTREERSACSTWETLAAQAHVTAHPTLPVQPWLQALEGRLLSTWEQAGDDTLHCPYCRSTAIAPKSKKPRLKKFLDAQGQLQTVEVLRYYCHNPACSKKSFTHFPSGLRPYSPYRTQAHLLTLQMYAWGYSTYRRSAAAVGVCSMTAFRWVSAWGHDLLPVAALFGVVKSSGVVGVDEKYVLVPKNDKPEGKLRRWMYVYVAVDLWTYDLLHIAIYPHNDSNSASAFLLALRAKGYHPQVMVTDLRQDYGPLIATVFPAAVHHECIFHALQNIHQLIQEVYGPDDAPHHPLAERLKQHIDAIFETTSRPEAEEGYRQVLALKPDYLADQPAAGVIFDFLEQHWPKLANAIGSDRIPTTNNVTELVIRRFDQHYQNFCGFENLESAQVYLGVFEKLYRFTPFSQDAQPRIRGKSPLQLAGYDVSKMPMTAICSGFSISWPTEVALVPN